MANIERNTFELNVSTNYLEIHFSTFLVKYALRCGCVGVCICLSNPKKCNVEIDKVSMALQVSGLLAIYWCQCSFFQTRSKSEWNQLRCLLKIFRLFFFFLFFFLLYSSIHLKRQLERVKVRKTLTHFYLPVEMNGRKYCVTLFAFAFVNQIWKLMRVQSECNKSYME